MIFGLHFWPAPFHALTLVMNPSWGRDGITRAFNVVKLLILVKPSGGIQLIVVDEILY